MTDAPNFADLSNIDPNMPMRLDVAAKLAFPDGSISASALRTEAKKGRLEMLRIANKDMVTLAAIEAMKKLCLIRPAELSSKPNTPLRQMAEPSREERAKIARDALLARLAKPTTPSREERLGIARDAALAKVRGRREQLSSDDRMARASETLKRAREMKPAAETAAERRRRPPTP